LKPETAASKNDADNEMEVVTLDDHNDSISSHKIVTLDDDEDSSKETSTTSAKKPERRVARKSTRPPQNPQRDANDHGKEDIVSPAKLGKRKLVESVSASPKKIARKSTKPPAFPQVIEMMFIDETSNDASDSDPVTEKRDDLNSSLLLLSPNRDEEVNEIEEITIC